MPKLPTDLSGRRVHAALERVGWVVPDHRQVNPGTLRGIIADAGLTVDEFVALLK